MELLTKELERLNVIQEHSKPIMELITKRSDLITKMNEFELTASDPKRLFRPSFQLNEEEKFRKTCVPTLLQLETKAKEAIQKYEHGIKI